MSAIPNDLWSKRRELLQKALIDAALNLAEHTRAKRFSVPVPGTTPPLFVVLNTEPVDTDAHKLAEYHEDFGPVTWWKFPVDEPAYIGTPLDSDWPGYHTHWTLHPPVPKDPTD